MKVENSKAPNDTDFLYARPSAVQKQHKKKHFTFQFTDNHLKIYINLSATKCLFVVSFSKTAHKGYIYSCN